MTSRRKSPAPDPAAPHAHLFGARIDEATRAFTDIATACKEGRAPRAEAIELIARAVPALLEPGDARARAVRFGQALGLESTSAAGAPQRNTWGDMIRVDGAVGWMIQREERLIADGIGKRAAGAQSVREAAAKFCQSARTLQGWRTKRRAPVEKMIAEERARRKAMAEEYALQTEMIARATMPPQRK